MMQDTNFNYSTRCVQQCWRYAVTLGFYLWIIEALCRHGAKKEFKKLLRRRITLLNARVKCQHYHTLLIGCFISSFKIWGFYIMNSLLGMAVQRHDIECKYLQRIRFILLLLLSELEKHCGGDIRLNSFWMEAVSFICSQLCAQATRTNAFHLISSACYRTCVTMWIDRKTMCTQHRITYTYCWQEDVTCKSHNTWD